jgi:hypothetical protein
MNITLLNFSPVSPFVKCANLGWPNAEQNAKKDHEFLIVVSIIRTALSDDWMFIVDI